MELGKNLYNTSCPTGARIVRASSYRKAYGSAGRWPALAAQGISQIDARACLQACGILLGSVLGAVTFSVDVGVL